MTFPRHIELILSHNPQNGNYETVAEHCDFMQVDPTNWVSEEQREKALRENELWQVQWYPDTPVGFCRKLAADLDALVEWMNAYAMDEATSKIPAE